MASQTNQLAVDDPDTIVIPLSKTKLIFGIILSAMLVMASLAVWFMGHGLGVKVWGAVGLAFFGVGSIIFAFMIIQDRPGLIITPTELVIHAGAIGEQRVPWSDVIGIQVTHMGQQRFLTIVVIDPDEDVARLDWFRKMVTSANQWLTGSPFNISANALACSFDELWEIMSDAFDRYARSDSGRSTEHMDKTNSV